MNVKWEINVKWLMPKPISNHKIQMSNECQIANQRQTAITFFSQDKMMEEKISVNS